MHVSPQLGVPLVFEDLACSYMPCNTGTMPEKANEKAGRSLPLWEYGALIAQPNHVVIALLGEDDLPPRTFVHAPSSEHVG